MSVYLVEKVWAEYGVAETSTSKQVLKTQQAGLDEEACGRPSLLPKA